MIKKCILAITCCLPIAVCAQKRFTIHGQVGSQNKTSKAILFYIDNDKKIFDSVLLHKGQFNFSGKVAIPVPAVIYILNDTATSIHYRVRDEERERTDLPLVSFYIENADITVTSKDCIRHATVKSSSTDAESTAVLVAMEQPFNKMLDSLEKAYGTRPQAEQKDSSWFRTLKRIADGRVRAERAFMDTHPNSYYNSLTLFKKLDLPDNFNPDTAAGKFARFFSKDQRKSPYGKQLQAMIDIARTTGIGKMAPDFAEIDSTGKKVSLSDFRGHYVLLDFWASWCHPCRAENPNYLKAYNKYKDKNFTILGVSVDDEKARNNWLQAVRADKLTWTQLYIKEGNKPVRLYGISAIPRNFLIDPDGRIIGKDLRGEALDEKLSKLFSM